MTLRHPQDAGAVTLSPTLDQATRVSWKTPIAFTLFTIVSALLFIGLSNDGQALFQFSPAGDAWQIPVLLFASRPVGVVGVALLALISIVSIWLTFRRRRTPLWLAAIYIAVLLVAFLAWAASSAQTNVIPLAGLLAGSLSLAVPLVYGSLAGVIGERVGVVNIAIEGQLLFGAFSSALVASITGSVWAGLIAAAVAGVLVGMVLAVFSIKYFVDQIIVGVVLNVLIVGLTSFLYSELLTPNAATLNTPPRFEVWAIPGLADIPLIGPMLFRQTPIVYLAYIAVFLVWWGLFRTRWGLRLRSVGEHPTAADTVGINVERTRFWNVSLAGGIAGLGGSFYTLGLVGAFGQEMTNGAGYIALAAVIFGK
ncbi:MAG TPA: ABC transporter permease, partial [Microbacteriaceae bacterium]|nr:ABC transporter permease [Microbacteriaceae bacterium]